MGTEFVEGWRIAQTLGEGTFGEYVQIILYYIKMLYYNFVNFVLGLNTVYVTS